MDAFSPHVLVVAASPALRFTLEELLRHYGYTVITAARTEAAELLAHGSFDVVVCDEALSAIPETESTPLIRAQPQTVQRPALEAEWIQSLHISA